MVGAILIAKFATCDVKINQNCLKGSCELRKGAFFEQINVLHKDSFGIPDEYIVSKRFECYNPGLNKKQKYWPSKIYFKKTNGHYKWKADTVNVHVKLIGPQKIFTQKVENNYYANFIANSKNFDMCPINFQNNTWYTIDIIDPRVGNIFLYVDKKNKFHIYKFDSGICPI